MKNILIIKTGDTFPEIKAVHGDFEDMFEDCLKGLAVNTVVYDAREQATFPDLKQHAAVIITGSHSMVTDCEPWSERLLPYVREMKETKVPVLGICYGHQLIAKALGGKIAIHPEGPQAGSSEITLTEAGIDDSLLGQSPESFMVNAGNSQRVDKLPDGAIVLAGNDFEPHQAVRFADTMWGLQFHPEFDQSITRHYIERAKETLYLHARNAKNASLACINTPESKNTLVSFVDLLS